MMILTKLNDIYKDWITGDGVFTDLNGFDVPWKNDDESALVNNLNMAYHGAHSGDKNISPVVHKFIENDNENARTKLANIIFTMYNDKWSKLWDALNIEYNPIQNYDMTEHEETDNTTTHAGTDTVTMTGTDTNAKTGTDTVTMTGTDTETHTGDVENEISAFNSSNYSDSAKNNQNTTDTETRNMTDATQYGATNTETRNMTDTTTHDTSEVLDGERTLTRSGNIGVTTSQQMLQSEIELRKWLYYQSVFDDIDNILTLSIY